MAFIGYLLYKLTILRNFFISKYLSKKIAGKYRSVHIGGDVQAMNPQNIIVGKNVYINGGQIFAGKESKIIIGNDVMISYCVHIRTTYHNYKNRKIPMIEQGMKEKDIKIGNNVWIGHSAHIMPGVKIGNGSVIGANAVVTHDIPENCVYGGVPAKLITHL